MRRDILPLMRRFSCDTREYGARRRIIHFSPSIVSDRVWDLFALKSGSRMYQRSFNNDMYGYLKIGTDTKLLLQDDQSLLMRLKKLRGLLISRIQRRAEDHMCFCLLYCGPLCMNRTSGCWTRAI